MVFVLRFLVCAVVALGGISAAHAEKKIPLPRPRPAITVEELCKTTHDLYWLARAGYGEARDQGRQGELDVMHAVVNRALLNKSYFGGNSIEGVVRHKTPRGDGTFMMQFSSIPEGDVPFHPKEFDAWFNSLTLAWEVCTGQEQPQGRMKKALYFMDPPHSSEGNKRWFYKDLLFLVQSGEHLFFGERPKHKPRHRAGASTF